MDKQFSISNLFIELFPESSCLTNQLDNYIDILTKLSSYTKLVRVIAWILRFAYNARFLLKIECLLNSIELNTACKTIIKRLQYSAFSEEFNLFKQKKLLPTSSELLSLNFFLHANEILRFGKPINLCYPVFLYLHDTNL